MTADVHDDDPVVAAAAPASFGSGRFDEAARLDELIPDHDWSVLPEGAHRIRFDAPSGALAGVEQGEAGRPRVLLVPGATGSKEDFRLMLPLLAAAGYHVQSFDLAGQYESAAAGPENLAPPREHYDYELFADDLISVLESGVRPVHVLGYSFAGIVAQLVLSRRPELFASLSLMSCPPQPGQSFRGIKRIGAITGLGSERLGAALMIWGIKANVTRVPPGRIRFAKQRFGLTRRNSVSDIIGLMRDAPDCRAALTAASIPLLVAVGEHDLWPLSLHAAFAREVGARIEVYRSGHSPCETSPHQLSRELLEMFEASERGDGRRRS